MRTGLALTAAILALTASTRLEAANLAPNRQFDENVDDWAMSIGATIVWSPMDVAGDPASGSLSLQAGIEEASPFAWTCVPVTPFTTYVYGARARIPGGQEDAFASARVRFAAEEGCKNFISFDNHASALLDLHDVWGTVQATATAPAGAVSAELLLLVEQIPARPGLLEASFDDAFFLESATCAATATTLCLNQGRFRVRTQWEKPSGETGVGQAARLTDDSGYFWFFDSANVELVTKLLDACPTQFATYWFFAAGLTNVYTRILVTDTEAEAEQVYENPLGTPFEAIQDTGAFATCGAGV